MRGRFCDGSKYRDCSRGAPSVELEQQVCRSVVMRASTPRSVRRLAMEVPRHGQLRLCSNLCRRVPLAVPYPRAVQLRAGADVSASTAMLMAGVAPQQMAHNTRQTEQAGSSRQHNAAAASTASVGIPFSQSRSLFFPGIVLGALLMLAAQRAWVWAQGLAWAQQIMDALDIRRSSGGQASTSSPPRLLPPPGTTTSGQQARDRASSEGPAGGWQGPGTNTYNIPDSPEMRTVFSSLTDAINSKEGQDQGESVEWVNMCWRKVWRVYQRGLERWMVDLLQPVFDGVVSDGSVPRFVQRLRIVEFTLDHEAPLFTNMRRRYSRKDSDLTGVVDLRYTGGARMLLMLEVGGGRWRFKIPVLVSDLDIDCQMWIKIRLAPMCPWIGTMSVAFVGPPNVKVQLSPYNRVRLMRVPVVQSFLRRLLTIDLPSFMVLPKRLEVAIPPSVTSVAEAAVGRDTIMRAVASAVLQADAVEQALLAALPLGPQTPAGGVSLPEAFRGEFDVVLREARGLPVWGFPGQSNPYVRMLLGEQAVQSRRDDDTSSPGRHRHPVWNQEFQFLVEDPRAQKLEIEVRDSHLTGRVEVGTAALPLSSVPLNGERVSMWLPLTPPPTYASRVTAGGPDSNGEVLLEVAYKAFDEEYDEQDSGYREAQTYQSVASRLAAAVGGHAPSQASQDGEERITDIRSAAAASSRAAVAASAALSAIAMTKAAAARAAMRAARAAQEAAASAVAAAGNLPKSVSPPPQLPAPPPTPAVPPVKPNAAAKAAVAADAKAAVAADVRDTAVAALAGARPNLTGQVRPPSQADDDTPVGGDSDSDDGYGGGQNGSSRAVVPDVSVLLAKPGSDNGTFSRSVDRDASGLQPGPKGSMDDPAYDRLSHHYRTERTGGFPVREPLPAASPPSTRAGTVGAEQAVAAQAGTRQRAAAGAAAVASTGVAIAARSRPEAIASHVEPKPTTPDPSTQLPPALLEVGASTLASIDADTPITDEEQRLELAVEALSAAADTTALPPALAAALEGALAQEKQIVDSVESGPRAAQMGDDYPYWQRETRAQEGVESAGQQGGQGQQPKQAKAAPEVKNNDWVGAVLAALSVLTSSLPAGPGSKPSSGGSKATGDAATPSTPATKEPQGGKPWWAFWDRSSGGASPSISSTSSLSSQDGGHVDFRKATLHVGDGSEPQPDGKEQPQGEKAWWAFWDWGPGGEPKATSSLSSVDGNEALAEAKDAKEKVEKAAEGEPWWKFWGWGPNASQDGGDSQGKAGDGSSKPVDAIVIPPDLPFEEIAKEVARLKDESWRSKEERIETLWAKASQRNDRPWIILCAALLAVTCVLLAFVASRLEQGGAPVSATDVIVPLATLQLLLAMLSSQ